MYGFVAAYEKKDGVVARSVFPLFRQVFYDNVLPNLMKKSDLVIKEVVRCLRLCL